MKRGDTLYKIALDNGLDYRELAAWNSIENVNLIREGQVLRLAAPGEAATTATGVTTTPLRALPPVETGETRPAVPPPVTPPGHAGRHARPDAGAAQFRQLQDATQGAEGALVRTGVARRPAQRDRAAACGGASTGTGTGTSGRRRPRGAQTRGEARTEDRPEIRERVAG